MGLGMFLFAAVDTIAKFLTSELHPFQIVWTRQLGLLAGALFLLALHGRRLFLTAQPKLQLIRGLVAALSAAAFIFAIRHVPLADAVAVSFLAPFMVTLMAALILQEPVGWRRWAAVLLGFVGSMIILRPGMGAVHPAAMLVVVAAFFFACRQVISRAIADTDGTGTTILYTAVTAVLVLSLPLPWVWVTPDGSELLLLVGMAMLAGFAEVFVIRALELGFAVAVAPVHYTLIIWASLYGWLVFGQFPDAWTWAGTAIIMATGMYTLRREYLAGRRGRYR
ncbi:MAG: DMT family transporter [Boseongicola sp. SB0676_bin_33]|nr:DMT family transporter [Boseongicola sp. SB0676_bin_33]MYK32658.1 DMT family transporter [Boseongicola sp. SB0670_bin_30]